MLLPLAFERTTSYGRGTAAGPAAILAASSQVELWDQELGLEPVKAGIHTLPLLAPAAARMADAIAEIEAAAKSHLQAGKWLLTLGGEHSLTLATVRAALAQEPGIGVLQFDAHADLRQTYAGSPHSHACVMRRLLDLQLSTAAIGVRSLSAAEAKLIEERNLPVIWGSELRRADELIDEVLERLPPHLYLTFDLDYFDPSILPSTGTPEPGGGGWYPTLRLLRRVFEQKEVVAMDVVELAPHIGQPASDFMAAKLIYKCLGYRFFGAARA